jgi:hypothetical protein
VEDAKKQALIDAENKAKETALEAESKSIFRKICTSSCCKKAYLPPKATATPSGLTYKIVKRRYQTS